MATKKQPIIRIGIDGGSYNPDFGVKSGIERLLTGFLHEVGQSKPANKRFYFYGFRASHLEENNLSLRKLPERMFSSLFLPAHLFIDRINVYLGFSGVIPPFLRLFGMKTVVFIHDFAFLDHPENYGDPAKMKWQTEYAIFGADKIIVFSEYIRDQVLKRYPKLPSQKIIRIYPGGDHFGRAGSVAPDLKRPYFLYVGVIKPAKNILVLLSRFEKLIRVHKLDNLRLVLAGPQELPYMKTIEDTLVYHKLKGRIEFHTDLSDTKLKELYLHSLGLLNVSHEEGFCYPVIESLELGRPAIVNDIPLYHEFAPYFKGLHITKTEDEFIEILKTVAQKPHSTKQAALTPFKWRSFTKTLIGVVDSIKL